MDQIIKNFIKNNQMDELGKYILMNTRISVDGTNYRPIEIELYICTDTHKDVFTHCHSKQKDMLMWYFHQMSEKENSYKGGTFKGLDIACGFNDGYGGVLIRSLLNETDNTVIEGPCKCVDMIIGKLKASSVKDLIDNKLGKNLSCFNPKLKLNIVEHHPTDIYQAPRIGLTLKGDNAKEKEQYINRNYRYIVFKDQIKKEKKKMVKMN